MTRPSFIPAHPHTGTVRPPDPQPRCGCAIVCPLLEGCSTERTQEPGETPPSPLPSSRANGRRHAATGLIEPRGRVLPVLPASKCAWREHHEQTAGQTPPSFMVFGMVELLDRSAIRACVEKNLLVQAGQRFVNFWIDRVWTTRVRKSALRRRGWRPLARSPG